MYSSTENDKFIVKQSAKKYLKYFGTGVMLFKYGYNKDLNVPDGVYYAQTL